LSIPTEMMMRTGESGSSTFAKSASASSGALE